MWSSTRGYPGATLDNQQWSSSRPGSQIHREVCRCGRLGASQGSLIDGETCFKDIQSIEHHWTSLNICGFAWEQGRYGQIPTINQENLGLWNGCDRKNWRWASWVNQPLLTASESSEAVETSQRGHNIAGERWGPSWLLTTDGVNCRRWWTFFGFYL